MLLVFSVLHQCFSENVMLKFLGKAYFGKHLVPFLFTQFMDFKTLLVQSSVSCNDPPFSFSNIRLFDFTTPFPIVGLKQFQFRIQIIIVLNFVIRSSGSKFDRLFCFEIAFPSLSFLILNSNCWWMFYEEYTFNKSYWNVRVRLWFYES